MMLTSQHMQSCENIKNGGPGSKKNRLMKYRQVFDFGGFRRRSQNVEGGPKQRFDGSRPGPTKFLYAELHKVVEQR
jgi:hypothetical protein